MVWVLALIITQGMLHGVGISVNNNTGDASWWVLALIITQGMLHGVGIRVNNNTGDASWCGY